jgi:hypothetical protein
MRNTEPKRKRGRPTSIDGRNPSLTVRMPESMINEIDRDARDRGIGRSEMLRLMLEERLELAPVQIVTRTAYHEAAHAVIARILGGRVVSASIEYDSGFEKAERDGLYRQRRKVTEGRVQHLTLGKNDKSMAHAKIIVCFAGRVAEEVLLGLKSCGGEEGDLKHIAKIAKKNSITRTGRLRQITHMLIWRHADAIHKVAASLLLNKTIIEAHVDRAIKASRKRTTPVFCMCCRGGINDVVRYLT